MALTRVLGGELNRKLRPGGCMVDATDELAGSLRYRLPIILEYRGERHGKDRTAMAPTGTPVKNCDV